MSLDDIDTPAVLVDLDVVGRNLKRLQVYCDDHDLRSRPHIKTHKIVAFARRETGGRDAGRRARTLELTNNASRRDRDRRLSHSLNGGQLVNRNPAPRHSTFGPGLDVFRGTY